MLCPEPVLFIYFFYFSSVILQFRFCDYFSAKKTDFFFFLKESKVFHTSTLRLLCMSKTPGRGKLPHPTEALK